MTSLPELRTGARADGRCRPRGAAQTVIHSREAASIGFVSGCRVGCVLRLQPIHDQEMNVIGVGIGHALAGIVGGKLSSVMISVSQQVMEDVDDLGMVFLAAGPPKVDDIGQLCGDEVLEGLAILIEALEKLLFGEYGERGLSFLLARDPLEPNPFANNHMA